MGYLFQQSDTKVLVVPELQRKIHPLKDLIALIKLFIIMVNEKPDIVDTHTAKAGVLGRLAAWIYKLAGSKASFVLFTLSMEMFSRNISEAFNHQFSNSLKGTWRISF
jgi:hypothetical protein